MQMKIKHLRPTTLPFPEYKTAGAAGMDLYFDGGPVVWIKPGQLVSLPTNVAVEIPEGFEGQIRGRSGMAFNKGLIGYLGTIDSDYRGELKALLHNTSNIEHCLARGDRIAQLVIAPVVRVTLEPGEFSDTERGENGFGSTGVK